MLIHSFNAMAEEKERGGLGQKGFGRRGGGIANEDHSRQLCGHGEPGRYAQTLSDQGKREIAQDLRTNSLIVKDTEENIERMKQLVEVLDTQTPQVLIESKIVEISEGHSKTIGACPRVNWGYDRFGIDGQPPTTANPGYVFFQCPPGRRGCHERNLFSFCHG